MRPSSSYPPSCAGTTMNYFLDGRMNRAELLFPGVACFLVAAVLGSITHAANKNDERRTLSREKSMEECAQSRSSYDQFMHLIISCNHFTHRTQSTNICNCALIVLCGRCYIVIVCGISHWKPCTVADWLQCIWEGGNSTSRTRSSCSAGIW